MDIGPVCRQDNVNHTANNVVAPCFILVAEIFGAKHTLAFALVGVLLVAADTVNLRRLA